MVRHIRAGCAALFASALVIDIASKAAAIRCGMAVENFGAAFSFAPSVGRVSVIYSLFAAAVAALMWRHLRTPLGRYGTALMAAGVAGNLFDRALRGYVVDWIPIMRLMWNLADIYLCLGGFIAIVSMLRGHSPSDG